MTARCPRCTTRSMASTGACVFVSLARCGVVFVGVAADVAVQASTQCLAPSLITPFVIRSQVQAQSAIPRGGSEVSPPADASVTNASTAASAAADDGAAAAAAVDNSSHVAAAEDTAGAVAEAAVGPLGDAAVIDATAPLNATVASASVVVDAGGDPSSSASSPSPSSSSSLAAASASDARAATSAETKRPRSKVAFVYHSALPVLLRCRHELSSPSDAIRAVSDDVAARCVTCPQPKTLHDVAIFSISAGIRDTNVQSAWTSLEVGTACFFVSLRSTC